MVSNGYTINLETREAYRFLLKVATGKVSEAEVEKWVATHLTKSRLE